MQALVDDGHLNTRNEIHRFVVELFNCCTLGHTTMRTGGHLLTLFVTYFNGNWTNLFTIGTHTLYESRADCIGGMPEDLYDMPQNYGNTTFQ